MRAILWFIISLLIVYVVSTLARSLYLLRQGSQLFAHSARFTTDYYVGAVKDPPLLYVALGDSTAAGTGADAAEQGYVYAVAAHLAGGQKYVHVVNVAVSGARVADVLNQQLPKVNGLHPDVVSVSVGANDATHFTDLVQYRKTIQLIVDSIIKLQPSRVLFANTPDLFATPALPVWFSYVVGKRAAAQNRVLASVVTDKHVDIVDIFNQAKLDYRADPALYAPDLFHPSAKGYQQWSSVFIAQIK